MTHSKSEQRRLNEQLKTSEELAEAWVKEAWPFIDGDETDFMDAYLAGFREAELRALGLVEALEKTHCFSESGTPHFNNKGNCVRCNALAKYRGQKP